MNGVHDLGGTDGPGPVAAAHQSGQYRWIGTALDDRTAGVFATPRSANHHHAHPRPVAVDPAR